MEIRSRYHESVIKTYGFKEVLALSFVEICSCPERLSAWAACIHKMGEHEINFEMVLCQCNGTDALSTYLLFRQMWENEVREDLNAMVDKGKGEICRFVSPVELLYFFGPHFGDRCGIAAAAFSALNRHKINVVASGCSGASVFLVLGKGMALKAKDIFRSIFDVP